MTTIVRQLNTNKEKILVPRCRKLTDTQYKMVHDTVVHGTKWTKYKVIHCINWHIAQNTSFFYKHNVYKHTEAQIPKKLSIF